MILSDYWTEEWYIT